MSNAEVIAERPLFPQIAFRTSFYPCNTQVELVWSNSVKNTGIKAKTKRMGPTERAALMASPFVIAVCLCAPCQKLSGNSIFPKIRLEATTERYQSPATSQSETPADAANELRRVMRHRVVNREKGQPDHDEQRQADRRQQILQRSQLIELNLLIRAGLAKKTLKETGQLWVSRLGGTRV